MNKSLCIIGCLLLLIAPQVQAQKELQPKIKLTASELDAVGSLLFGGKDNKVSACVDSSFELLLGLTFLKIGKAKPNAVYDAIVKSAQTGAIRDEKERQYKIWLEKRAPEAVASADLQYCLDRNEVAFSFSSMGDTCMGLMQVQTTAFALKNIVGSHEEVAAQMRKLWAVKVKGDYVQKVTDSVLKHSGTDAEKMSELRNLNRSLFYRCLEQENAL